MKNIIYLLTVLVIFAIVACGGKQEAKQSEKSTQKAQVIYYGCPMTDHSHIADKEPGKCEECGMDMVAVVKTTVGEHNFYGCPMAEHSHIRQAEPGECADCGMTYRPLKFDI